MLQIYANLLLKALNVLHLRLGNRLHRPDGLGGDVRRLAHRAIRALAQLLLVHLVMVRDLARVLDDELSIADTTILAEKAPSASNSCCGHQALMSFLMVLESRF